MLNRFHTSLLATLPITLLYGLSTRFLFQSDMGVGSLDLLADGKVLLHLSSKHRLSTRFNAYGGLWTDFIMSDLKKR